MDAFTKWKQKILLNTKFTNWKQERIIEFYLKLTVGGERRYNVLMKLSVED